MPVVSMLDRAWGANALTFNLIHATMKLLEMDIDVAVVFPVGICLGWLGLFLLDRSKRIQAILLGVTGVGFVFILIQFGRWATTVDWMEHLLVLVLGVALGVTTGLVGAYSDRHTREFPVAAAGLYVIVTLVTVMSLFEAHLAYKSPVDAFPGITPPPVRSSLLIVEGLAIDVVSTVLFVMVLATFVQYDDRKDVVLIAPSGESETTVLAGLFDRIRNRQQGHSIDDATAKALSDAVGTIKSGARPDLIREEVILRFKRPGALSRWVEISPDDSPASHLGTPPFHRLRKRQRRRVTEWLRRGATRTITVALPFKLSRFAPTHRRLIERIDSADVVVLVARTPDALGREAEYIEAYREIDDIYAGVRSKRILIGALDPEAAFDEFETERGLEPTPDKSSFRDYLRRSVFGVRGTVIPLSISAEEAETLKGSDELIGCIER